MLETPYGAAVDPAALAARLRADTGRRIDGILLTQNETSTGVQNTMAELAAAIGDHPATVIVDAVSGLGASDFRMDEWGFDIVVTASQKALAVPPGLAMIAVESTHGSGWRRRRDRASIRIYARHGNSRRSAKPLGHRRSHSSLRLTSRWGYSRPRAPRTSGRGMRATRTRFAKPRWRLVWSCSRARGHIRTPSLRSRFRAESMRRHWSRSCAKSAAS